MLPPAPLLQTNTYKEHLAGLKRELDAQIEGGTPLDAHTVTAGLLPEEDNSLIRKWAAKNGIPTKNFDQAMRGHKIIRELGAIPTTPKHLLDLVLARDGIQCRYNGLLDQTSRPRVRSGTKLIDVSESDLTDPAVATLTHFTAPSKLTVSELALNLRTTTANLKLEQFPRRLTREG